MEHLEDAIINRYRIQHQLAKGGMSEIYLATTIDTNESVAIKLVHQSNREFYARFRHEVKVIAELQHEHILPALDYGEYQSWYYMVTPYIADGTLHARLMQDPLTPDEAGHILAQLVSALQFAHDHGIIHRDIKPSNVLLRDGTYVYLADFGLVKKVGEDNGLTVTGYLIGTPEYMAPELAEEEATPISDVYALGILLYQMLTGTVPFKGTTPIATFLKHLSTQPIPPSQLNAAIPVSIEKVILRALEKTVHKRFQTAQDLLLAYQQALKEPVYMPIEERMTHLHLTRHLASVAHHSMVKRRSNSSIAVLASVIFLIVPLLLGISIYSVQHTDYPLSAQQIHLNHTISTNSISPTPTDTTTTTNDKTTPPLTPTSVPSSARTYQPPVIPTSSDNSQQSDDQNNNSTSYGQNSSSGGSDNTTTNSDNNGNGNSGNGNKHGHNKDK